MDVPTFPADGGHYCQSKHVTTCKGSEPCWFAEMSSEPWWALSFLSLSLKLRSLITQFAGDLRRIQTLGVDALSRFKDTLDMKNLAEMSSKKKVSDEIVKVLNTLYYVLNEYLGNQQIDEFLAAFGMWTVTSWFFTSVCPWSNPKQHASTKNCQVALGRHDLIWVTWFLAKDGGACWGLEKVGIWL